MKNRFSSDTLLLVFLLSLIYFPLFYSIRTLDDNTLTSWKWVFHGVDKGRVFILLLLGALTSLALAKLNFIRKHPVIVISLLTGALVIPSWFIPEAILDASRFLSRQNTWVYSGLNIF